MDWGNLFPAVIVLISVGDGFWHSESLIFPSYEDL